MADLYKTPPTMPISELRKHSDDVFDQLKQTHILLTRQGNAAGVLVHPTVWNRVLDRLDELEATVWALEAELEIAQGESELIDVTDEMLVQWSHPSVTVINASYSARMLYQLKIKREVAQQIGRLPGRVRQRIVKLIDGLRSEPRPSIAKSLRGQHSDKMQISLVVWRIVYQIDDEVVIVEVLRVGKKHGPEFYE